jgi:D-glycero-D-manno-heptose 1,7-bisphosphate phosphatase
MSESSGVGATEITLGADLSLPDARPRRPAVFLDKDGTLIENVPYNVDPELLRFTPNAVAALRLFAQAGYSLAVITNQPGLEGGRFSPAQFESLRQALIERIWAEAGVEVAAFEHCPHLPDPGGRPLCVCRKPGARMIERAAEAQNFDLERSWMIGDILDDVEAGRRAGCRTVLLDVGNETLWQWSPLRTPDHRCKDLLEAARIIAGRE